MKMRKRRTIINSLKIAVLGAVIMLMSSCPQQITAPMVALVEDTLPPTLTISSPKGGDQYFSVVTVTGNIYDDVLEENDESGQITTIYYEITNDDYRKGKINIGLDDSITADEKFGDGVIEYDILTGDFSFSFSTLLPNKFHDQISITITAVDRNNNDSIYELSLKESDGAYLDFDFYSSPDHSEASKITSLAGDNVYIAGSVANSIYDLDSASEIVGISWGIKGTFWGGELDVTPGSADWVDALGIFRVLNNDEDYYFDYNPLTREFNTHQAIQLDNGMYFFAEAEDAYGHSVEIQKLLSPPTPLTLSRPTIDTAYYSPTTGATLTVTSKIIDPNDLVLSATEVGTITYEYQAVAPADTAALAAKVTALETADPDYFTLYDDPVNFNAYLNVGGVNGQFQFPVNTDDFNSLTGDIAVKITVTDTDDPPNTIPKKSIILENDAVAPTISAVNFEDDNSDGYLRRLDRVNLSFTASDYDAGLPVTPPSVSVTGESLIQLVDITETGTTLDPLTGKRVSANYLAVFEIRSTAVSTANGDKLGYNITLSDNVGNERIETDSDLLTFYSPYSNSYSYEPDPDSNPATDAVIFESNNERSSVFYARAVSPNYDEVTITFTSTRVLSGTPTALVAGRPASVSNSGLDYTVTYVTNGSETTAENAAIPFSIAFTDAAGNTDVINNGDTSTSVIYDDAAPGEPGTPVYIGSNGDNYINNTEADSISMTVPYGTSNTLSGDTVQLYLDDTADVLLGEHISTGGTSSSISVTNRNLIDAGGGSSDGAKVFYARVIDKAGNTGLNSPLLSSITLDTTLPSATITGNPAYGDILPFVLGMNTSDTDISTINWGISGTGTDPNTGGAVISRTNPSPEELSISDCTIDGEYTVTLNVTDNAGNPGPEDTHVFNYDETEFTQSVTGFPTNDPPYTGSTLILSATPSGAESGIASSLWQIITKPAGADNMNLSTPNSDSTEFTADTDGSDDGDYTIRITTTDGLGRPVVTDNSFKWETAAPTWNSPSPVTVGSINNTGYTIPASATDTGSGLHNTLPYQWTIDVPGTSTDAIQNSAVLSFSGFTTNGSYSAYCIAQDNAGNSTAEADQTVSFNWDTAAPVINVTNEAPSDVYIANGDAVVITFTLSDDSTILPPTATIMGETAAIAGGPTYTASYTLSGKTSDADGTAATYTIYSSDDIDVGSDNTGSHTPGTAPYIFYGAYNNSDSGYFYSSGISITSNNSADSNYWAKTGDEITVSFTGVRELTGKPVIIIGGQTVPAVDVDYNTGSKVCSATFTVPAAALTDGVTPLSEGDDIPVTITVTDAAGNSGSYTHTSAVNYDNTAPAQPTAAPDFPGSTVSGYINLDNIDGGSITFQVDGITAPTSPSVVTTYLYRDSETTPLASTTSTGDNVSLTISGTAAQILTALGGQGLHSYYAQSVDSAGNEGTASATFTVTVDTVIDTCDAGDNYNTAATSKTTGSWTQDASAGDSSTPITTAWTFYIGGSSTSNVSATSTAVTDVEITGCSADATYTGRLTVTDAAGNSDYSEFSWIWDTSTPVVNAGADHLSPNGMSTGFSQAGSATDASTISSYSWSLSGAATGTMTGATLNINTGSNKITIATNGNDDGLITATLTATDRHSLAGSDSFQFFWDTQDPVSQIDNATITDNTTNYTLSPHANTTDNTGIVSYSWSVPAGLNPVSTTTRDLVLTNFAIGSYALTLTVTDGAGRTASDNCTLTVNVARTISFSDSNPSFFDGGSGSAPGGSDSVPLTTPRMNFSNLDSDSSVEPEQISYTSPAVLYQRTADSVEGYRGSFYKPAAVQKTGFTENSSAASEPAAISDSETLAAEDSASGKSNQTFRASAAPAAASAAINQNTGTGGTIDDAPVSDGANGSALLLLLIPAAAAGVLIFRKRRP